MRHIFLFLFVALGAFPAAAEPAKTVIEDQAEAELLLGRHLFTEWYLNNNALTSTKMLFGEAVITEKDGHYRLDASHECYWRHPRYYKEPEGGYIKVAGDIVAIRKKEFLLQGRVQVYHMPYTSGNGDKPVRCEVKGEFTFVNDTSGAEFTDPSVWALKIDYDLNHQNSMPLKDRQCLIEAASIEITIAQLEGEAPHPDCVRDFKDFDSIPEDFYQRSH